MEFALTAPTFQIERRVVIVRGRVVKAIASNHPCDERCTSAKGNLCECSCGGVNHGRDYRAGVVLAPVAEVARSLF